MWTRQEVKKRAKEALSRNYWKVVLVVILLLFIGGGSISSVINVNRVTVNNEEESDIEESSIEESSIEESNIDAEERGAENSTGTDVFVMKNDGAVSVPGHIGSEIRNVTDRLEESLNETAMELEQVSLAVWIAFGIVILMIVFFVIVIITAVDILVLNPLYVGMQRFMLKSVDGTGNISELGYTFDHNYKNGVRTTFFRDLHILLWAFVFIIPAIYKKYQYYMVDYILAENPDMPYKEVLERSQKMMDGHKWNTFVLDISFILWHMLSVVTCGISEVFYVIPYIQLTRASLYRTLQENTGNAADNAAGNVAGNAVGNVAGNAVDNAD